LFYVAALFNEIRFKHVLFAVFLIVMSPAVFSFYPVKTGYFDASMPLADYKGAYAFLNESVPLVVGWSPAAYWYGHKADYQLNYSLSGTGYGFWRTVDGRERFCNAVVVNSMDELPDEFVVVLDAQAARKIPPGNYDFSYCEEIFSSYDIKVLMCTKAYRLR
jgi:hypothetical protein